MGRVAPYTKGHEILTNAILKAVNGNRERVIFLIGSTNVLNDRTPFTPEQRKEMIQMIWEDIPVHFQKDSNPHAAPEDDAPRHIFGWIEQVRAIERKAGKKLVLCSGSPEDMEFTGYGESGEIDTPVNLADYFHVHFPVDRHDEGKGISATQARKALLSQNQEVIEKALHPDVAAFAHNFLIENVLIHSHDNTYSSKLIDQVNNFERSIQMS